MVDASDAADVVKDVAKDAAKVVVTADESSRLTTVLTLFMQGWLALGLVLFAVRRDWENVFLTLTVIGLIVVPAFLMRKWRIHVPAEFQLIAVAFVFLSLFLGSARDFYYKYWWWDIVLHTGSGFLFGVVGWIVLFLLLQSHRLPQGVGPALIAVFGVTFAVTLGVVWEIFEFAVDSLWPSVNMMSQETGVSDTMQDLIVDLIGAIIVAVLGWAHAKTGRYSFVVDGVGEFVRRNPRLFRKDGQSTTTKSKAKVSAKGKARARKS
jgi:hypothetical protein